MRKFRLMLAIAATLTSAQVLADTTTTSTTTTTTTLSDKSCEAIANACTAAGYTRGDAGDKKFWFNCMKPIMLGQAVDGVTVDAATVKACRDNKTEELTKELQEIQAAEQNAATSTTNTTSTTTTTN